MNEKNNDGDSCLMLACKQGRANVVELLVTLGADATFDEYGDGNTCMMEASITGYSDVAAVLTSKGGVEVNVSNGEVSYLTIASVMGRLTTVELLLSAGVNLRHIDGDNRTCFDAAASYGYSRILYRLRKWPTTMGIILVQELGLQFIGDESIIDLHQYIGKEDFTSDSNSDYVFDANKNVMDDEKVVVQEEENSDDDDDDEEEEEDDDDDDEEEEEEEDDNDDDDDDDDGNKIDVPDDDEEEK